MSRFQPTRASSPPSRNFVMTDSSIAPELQNLSLQDIEIIDAVIQRAGPSATTFFNVFKAYSDVLNERGLDPQEVVYYGKLLKLGTLKGKNWGEKWESVKGQVERLPVTPTLESLSLAPEYVGNDLLSESPGSEGSYQKIPDRGVSKKSSALEPLSKLRKLIRTGTSKETQTARSVSKERTATVIHPGTVKPDHDQLSVIASEYEEPESSPFPPSYKSTHFDMTRPHRLPAPSFSVNRFAANPTNVEKRTKDLDDAWKNIKMEQDEKFADKFRDDILLARCWGIWRQGFLWIVTTNQQVADARDKLLLELHVQRWLKRMAYRRAREDELIRQLQNHTLARFFGTWQAKLKKKRQEAWRIDMRQKMKIIKTRSDNRIRQEAWNKWWQHHRAHFADDHYKMALLARYFLQWKAKVAHLDDLDAIADNFVRAIQLKSLKSYFNLWKRVIGLRYNERHIARRVDLRLMSTTVHLWRIRIAQVRTAERFNQQLTLKHALLKWNEARNILKLQEQRAEKHLTRQNEVLLRAVFRIWRARMRGKRMEQYKLNITKRDAWQKWKASLVRRKSMIDNAASFFSHSNTRLASEMLHRWRQILATHRNAHSYAVAFHEDRLRAKMLLIWRVRLRENLQNAKIARWANKFFTTRRAWQTWVAAMEERKRQKRLELWNLTRAQRFFNVWRARTRQVQYFKECEQILHRRTEKRILVAALTRWTNRVIELKSRELDVAHQQDLSLLRTAFQKWRSCRLRHVEEVSLLENYLLVKQEDVLRRAFHRWLTAKRSAAHRRLTHQRKEAQLRQMTITAAWERWRERFKEERLRPLEYQLIFQSQKNMMSRAFRIWLSKTESLPAVKFHSMHLKEKFFKKWHSMIPNALRSKKARDTDRYNTLVRYFEKWTNAYKTKITLKAVARAKYLRLPPAPSRRAAVPSNSIYSEVRKYTAVQDEDSDSSDPSIAEPLMEPFVPRSRTAKSPRPRSERSLPRSEKQSPLVRHRATSPARSIVSVPDKRPKSPRSVTSIDMLATNRDNGGGGRLWAALKDIGPQRPRRNL